jgi:hypothetical protein
VDADCFPGKADGADADLESIQACNRVIVGAGRGMMVALRGHSRSGFLHGEGS